MKKLILVFMLFLPCTAIAETWSKGDTVFVFFMCQHERDIMEIAKADADNQELYSNMLMEKSSTGACHRFYPPLNLSVQNVLASYKDHNKEETCILELDDPKSSKAAGYILAAGSPKSLKDKSL
jgi:hypothetical protein